MAVRITVLALIAAIFLGCSKPEEMSVGVDGSADLVEPDATAIGAPSSAPPPFQDDPKAVVRMLDTARPPANKKSEPVLERPSFPIPGAGTSIQIPGGTLLRGSAPDDPLRDHFAENDNIPTPITPFEMDALPFPNDPALPFLTGLTRANAETKCVEQGKRLCTEVEWEWACCGEDGRRYPSGNQYHDSDYASSDLISPPSPFGVFAMGRILEWTASRWGADADQVERIAVRGYSKGELSAGKLPSERNGRRCAKRWHQLPETSAPNLGFRCCSGKVNEAVCFIERTRPAVSIYKNMKPDKFAKIIKSIPEISMIHDNPHMFSDADVRAVLARRSSDRKELARQGIHFRWKPLRWIPRQGMEMWVAVGRSNRHAFVVALHEVEDNEKYVYASSVILWNQPIPLVLAYREGHRDQLFWAPCWGCRDGGTVEFDDEKNQAIITYKW
jgi:hypothetical protein